MRTQPQHSLNSCDSVDPLDELCNFLYQESIEWNFKILCTSRPCPGHVQATVELLIDVDSGQWYQRKKSLNLHCSIHMRWAPPGQVPAVPAPLRRVMWMDRESTWPGDGPFGLPVAALCPEIRPAYVPRSDIHHAVLWTGCYARQIRRSGPWWHMMTYDDHDSSDMLLCSARSANLLIGICFFLSKLSGLVEALHVSSTLHTIWL